MSKKKKTKRLPKREQKRERAAWAEINRQHLEQRALDTPRGNPPIERPNFWQMVREGPPPGRLLPHWPMMGLHVELEDEDEDYELAVDIEAAKQLVNRLTEAIARAEQRRGTA